MTIKKATGSKYKLGIIGSGSAGILSTLHFLTFLNDDWNIYNIHNPNKSILGIGESTNPIFIKSLQNSINFNLLTDLKYLDGTFKFATVFKQWRDKYFYSPLIGGNIAIHFNTNKLQSFIFKQVKNKYKNKFKEIKGNVSNINNNTDSVKLSIDKKEYEFDFIIDCRGFPENYNEYTLCDLPLNHCLVHNVNKSGSWNYTGHVATKNGWMFQIPLTNRQSYGYLYNDTITTKEEALKDFESVVQHNIKTPIEYKFKSFFCNKVLDNRILKNGNQALFFEPMSANSLYLYDNINRNFYDYLNNHKSQMQLNNDIVNKAKEVEEMICFFYHGGSIFNTKFWKHAKEKTNKILKNSINLKRCIDEFKIHGKKENINNVRGWLFDPRVLIEIDKEFKYNYFK